MDVFQKFARLDQKSKRKLWKRINADNQTYPTHLVRVAIDFALPSVMNGPKEVWRSRGYMVQIYDVNEEWERMSINRTAFDPTFSRFLDGITWDMIQELKAQCGRGASEAMEIYPADDDVINVANLRHIWIRKNGKSFIRELEVGWTQGFNSAGSAAFDLTSITLGLSHTAQSSVSPDQHTPELQDVTSAV